VTFLNCYTTSQQLAQEARFTALVQFSQQQMTR